MVHLLFKLLTRTAGTGGPSPSIIFLAYTEREHFYQKKLILHFMLTY